MSFGCRVIKLGQFYLSENHQKSKQHSLEIKSNQNEKFEFYSGKEEIFELIENIPYKPPAHRNKKGLTYKLGEYLDEKTQTTAFLVIRKDTILFEKYFEGYDEQSLLPSYSVAKSFTGALTGIAIQEGFLKSEKDLVVKYLSELKELHPNWELMTIDHLLNMRSGIKFNENNYVNPYSGITDLYMTKDVWKILKKASFEARPGTRHYYSSLDTEIMGLILEKAIGKSLSEYLEEKIWKPCGMESDANWAVDSKKKMHTKAFCCISAVARDYAKFARLFLENGNWNGMQIIDSTWIEKSITPNFKNNCYQLFWYSKKGSKVAKDQVGKYKLMMFSDSISASSNIENPKFEHVKKHWSKKDNWIIQKCGPSFYALGVFGQEVYVNPETEMIFIRLGKKWDTSNPQLFELIQKEIENMETE